MLMDNKYQQNQTVVSRQDMETWYSKDTVTHWWEIMLTDARPVVAHHTYCDVTAMTDEVVDLSPTAFCD